MHSLRGRNRSGVKLILLIYSNLISQKEIQVLRSLQQERSACQGTQCGVDWMASAFLGAASAAGRFALRQLEATTTRFVHSSAVTSVSVSKGPTSVLQVSGEKFLPSVSSIGRLVGVAGVSKTTGAVLSCSAGCTRDSTSMAAHEAPKVRALSCFCSCPDQWHELFGKGQDHLFNGYCSGIVLLGSIAYEASRPLAV